MNNFKPNETMLQNYIQNKLNSAETLQVELWLADHPDVMDDLELDMMFIQAEYDTSEDISETSTSRFVFLDFFSHQRMLPIHVLAYTLVAFFLFSIFNKEKNVLSSPAIFIELEKQRGLNTTEIEVQTAKNKSVVLRFFPDSMHNKYRLVMESKSSNINYNFKNLVADELGSITVSIYSETKIGGEWEIFVIDDTTSIEQKFLISIN